MFLTFLHRLIPPVVVGEEQERWRAAVLRRIMVGDMLVSVAALGVGLATTPNPAALSVLIGAIVAWALALSVAARWLNVRLGGLLYLGGGAGFIGLLSAVSGGAHSPTFPAFVVLLLSAAYLFERRTLLVFAGYVLLWMAVVLAADLTAKLPAPIIPHEPIVVWFSSIAIAVLLIARLWDFTRLARDTLAQAQSELQERRRAEAQLVASEERFRRLFETMPDSYLGARLDGTVLIANQAAVDLLGYPLDELLGLNVRDQLYTNAADRDRLLAELERSGRVRGYVVNLRRKDGIEITVESNLQLLRDPDGRAYAIEGVQRDITPRIRAEQEVRRNHNCWSWHNRSATWVTSW